MNALPLHTARHWVRHNGARIALELGVNLALPYAMFRLVQPRLGDVGGLIVGAAPPLIWGVAGFIRVRRIDALSLVVLLGIALSLIAFAGGGGARMLQLREHLVAGVIGLVFLGSAGIGRPLIYQLARARLRRADPEKLGVFQSLRGGPIFRRAMMVMTLAWGIGLVAESALATVLVFTMSIKDYLIVTGIIGYSEIAALTAWTYWYARRRLAAAARAGATTASP